VVVDEEMKGRVVEVKVMLKDNVFNNELNNVVHMLNKWDVRKI
jgi:hypothetical protein